MRLFFAIMPDDPWRHALTSAQQQLFIHCQKASFTRSDNLHMTLVFLGETEFPERAAEIMSGIHPASFRLRLSTAGVFHKRGGDVWWIGVESSPQLIKLQETIHNSSISAGFALEHLPYVPHITLARNVRLADDFTPESLAAEPLSLDVHSFALMHSHRVNGTLTYTPLVRTSF